MVGAALEGASRVARALPPGGWAARLEQLVVVVVGVTAAGGLGLLVGGGQPREMLHFVYGAVALGILPLTSFLAQRAGPRPRGGATIVGSLVSLVVLYRLFATG